MCFSFFKEKPDVRLVWSMGGDHDFHFDLDSEAEYLYAAKLEKRDEIVTFNIKGVYNCSASGESSHQKPFNQTVSFEYDKGKTLLAQIKTALPETLQAPLSILLQPQLSMLDEVMKNMMISNELKKALNDIASFDKIREKPFGKQLDVLVGQVKLMIDTLQEGAGDVVVESKSNLERNMQGKSLKANKKAMLTYLKTVDKSIAGYMVFSITQFLENDENDKLAGKLFEHLYPGRQASSQEPGGDFVFNTFGNLSQRVVGFN